MKNIKQENDFFNRLMNLFEKQFGANCEVVLHDLTQPYESTIAAISNGHISGRKVGDAGTNLGLEVLRGTVEDGDRFNYITNTKNGKVLRSSSIYIHNDDGQVIGALCINIDITESLKFENFIREINGYSCVNDIDQNKESDEIFTSNVGELLDYLFQQGQKYVGIAAPSMTKEDKIKFLDYLDSKGAFLITKSSERTCEFLNISKYTLYQYLDIARKENNNETYDNT